MSVDLNPLTPKTVPQDGIITLDHALPPRAYNFTSLPRRIASDLLAALCTSTLIAPVVTIIDKSIVLRTSSSSLPLRTILQTSALSALTNPRAFLLSTPYRLITGLYFGTYTAANLSDTALSTFTAQPAPTTSAGPVKFLATSSVNMTLCVWKDAQFAKLFGARSVTSTTTAAAATAAARSGTGTMTMTAASKKVVPRSSLALFALRDSLTMFASFNVPPLLAPVLGSQNAAQFLAPAAAQIFSTPFHLLGFDLYNRPEGGAVAGGRGIGWRDRWMRIRRDWLGAALARMGRVVPAYGVGGVVNSGVRRWLLDGV